MQTGVMPLHTASFSGHLAIVEELLSHYRSADLIDMATEVMLHIFKLHTKGFGTLISANRL